MEPSAWINGHRQVPVVEPQMGWEERAAVDRVLRGGHLAGSAEVEAFEAAFSTFLGGRDSVAVNSALTGVQLSLLAAGVRRGDEVVMSALAQESVATAISLTGATPVLADIEHDSCCVDPKAVEAAITSRTAAIVATHQFGQPADMELLGDVAAAHGVTLVEDASQAVGAALDGRKVGTFGDVAVFDLGAEASMTAGSGCVVACADGRYEALVRELRRRSGSRLDEVSAAIGRAQLRRLPGFNRVRRVNAGILDDHLDDVVTPRVREGARHVYGQYAVRIADRDRVADHLAALGIDTDVPCPPYSAHPDLPEATWASAELLSLPVHPGVEADDVMRIADAVNDATASWDLAS